MSSKDTIQNLEAAGLVSRRRSTGYSAVDLLAADFEEPRFAVPDILAEGLNFFAGPPKLGKSWWALNIAVAVAAGGRALGKIPVEPGAVLYLALEDSPRRLKSRLERMLAGEPAPEGLDFYTEWNRLSEGGTEEIAAWVADHPTTRLIIVDVFARVRPRVNDARSDRYLADYEAAQPLKTVADQHGLAILALHHTRKAPGEDYVETVSGTHGLAASADTILVCKRSRGQADAVLHITGRDVEEKDLALRFDAGIGTWSLLGDAAEYALNETRRKILQALKDQSEGMRPKEIAEEIDIAYETVKKAVQRMARDGQLKVRDGIYRVPSVPLSPESSGDEGHGDTRDAFHTVPEEVLTMFPGSELAFEYEGVEPSLEEQAQDVEAWNGYIHRSNVVED
jgi:hypothetical protein